MDDKKKSILFACFGLGIGGVEKCLVNLLNILSEENYEIDVLLMNPEYAMKPQIRRNVCFVDDFHYILNTESTVKEIRKRGGFWKNRDKIIPYIDHRVRIKLGLPLWTKFWPLEKRYDIAVAYSQNGLAPYYVIDKVQADRKVLWYHNGAYERTGRQYEQDKQYYVKFDYIVAVSNDCAKMLRDKFPAVKEKIVVLRNICDCASVRQNALAFVPENFSKEFTHIVTVGRMNVEKGAELALEACRQLCAEGRNVCWHWVGSGDQAKAIQKKADKLGVHDRFVLEGNQTNPYPYIQCADVYVQPSYYEAYSTTITEAKVLHKPIVATDVGGMRDQLTDTENALIVPVDADAITDGIRALMDSKSLRDAFTEALKKETFDGKAALAEYERSVFL